VGGEEHLRDLDALLGDRQPTRLEVVSKPHQCCSSLLASRH
jgi:hypothetical protein